MGDGWREWVNFKRVLRGPFLFLNLVLPLELHIELSGRIQESKEQESVVDRRNGHSGW